MIECSATWHTLIYVIFLLLLMAWQCICRLVSILKSLWVTISPAWKTGCFHGVEIKYNHENSSSCLLILLRRLIISRHTDRHRTEVMNPRFQCIVVIWGKSDFSSVACSHKQQRKHQSSASLDIYDENTKMPSVSFSLVQCISKTFITASWFDTNYSSFTDKIIKRIHGYPYSFCKM